METPNETTSTSTHELLYDMDTRPPIVTSIILALQHILAAFAGIVAVPLVVGSALQLSVEEMAMMVSATIFASGITTVIQSRKIGPMGSGYPTMMGTDFTFVNPQISVGARFGIAGIVGATITGAWLEVILSRFIKPLMRFFPPLITGIVVTLIGVTLLPVSIDWAAGGVGAPDYASLSNLGIAFIVMLFTLFLNYYGKGIWSTGAVFWGMIFGYLICVPLGLVNLEPVEAAHWIALPRIFRYGVTFDLASTVSFLPAYLVSTIGTTGVLMAVGEASHRVPDANTIAGGVLTDGVGSMISGLFGAGPNTAFSQNVGLITLTRVASRHVMIVAGFFLVLLGVFPKVSALISVIPTPVLGGVGVIMFGLVAAQGIKSLTSLSLGTRELLIISVSLAMGIGVTVNPGILVNVPDWLEMMLSSGISAGTLTALILNLILKEKN